MGLIPNRKGQPMLVEWQVASRVGQGASAPFTLESFDAFIARAGLKAGGLPNRGHTSELTATTEVMQSALPGAVRACTLTCSSSRPPLAELAQRLESTLADLRLQGRQLNSLASTSKSSSKPSSGRFEQPRHPPRF
jgi:hypothetical protein